MTRIKKRRSGKNKTADHQKALAGRRMAKATAKSAAAQKEKDAAVNAAIKQPGSPKKKNKPAEAGRRGGRAVTKATRDKDQPGTAQLPADKTQKTIVKTGKTRSAGARRIAVSRSVANTIPKKPAAKTGVAANKPAAESSKKQKGFAPWNKNKPRGKGKWKEV